MGLNRLIEPHGLKLFRKWSRIVIDLMADVKVASFPTLCLYLLLLDSGVEANALYCAVFSTYYTYFELCGRGGTHGLRQEQCWTSEDGSDFKILHVYSPRYLSLYLPLRPPIIIGSGAPGVVTPSTTLLGVFLTPLW